MKRASLGACVGEVLTEVTEDRHRIILGFENGRRIEIIVHDVDAYLECIEPEPVHDEGCLRRWPVTELCSCITRAIETAAKKKGKR